MLKNLPSSLKKYECNGLERDPEFMDLLLRMIEFNPQKRISPAEILDHPFLMN